LSGTTTPQWLIIDGNKAVNAEFALYEIITLQSKWNLISLPFNESINKVNIIVHYNGSNYTWTEATNSTNQIILNFVYKWNVSSGYEYVNIIEPGYGYWLWAYKECELLIASNVIGDGYITELKQSWNIMGLPYNESLNKEDLIIHYNITDYSWENATSSNNEKGEPLILGFIYGWYRSVQTYMLSDTFDPGYGYWMYAYYECTLKKS
jgi:hypothetical protein